MARTPSKGLVYFPLVTEWDNKAKLVQAKFGLMGIGCLITLFQEIYHEGYALKWDEDTELLFSSSNNIPLPELKNFIEFATSRHIFDKGMLENKGVLTSHGIQKQWVTVAKSSHRKSIVIDPEICLLATDELSPEESQEKQSERGIPSGGNEASDELPSEEITQIKEKHIINNNQAQAEPSQSANETELYHKIKDSFIKVSGNFTNYAREGKGIKKIIAYTKGDEKVIKTMLDAFLSLTKSTDHFWSKQPYTPSTLAASGIWDRVKLEALKYAPPPPKRKEYKYVFIKDEVCPFCGKTLYKGDPCCRSCYADQNVGLPDSLYERVEVAV